MAYLSLHLTVNILTSPLQPAANLPLCISSLYLLPLYLVSISLFRLCKNLTYLYEIWSRENRVPHKVTLLVSMRASQW